MDKVYLCPPIDNESWSGVKSAFRLAGVTPEHWNIIDQQQAWKDRTLFVALGWENGHKRDGAKLYVHGAGQETVDAVMQAVGNKESEQKRAHLLCELHGRKTHDYVGFDLCPSRSIRTKVYGYSQDA